jgi:hypothetical protein
LQRFTGKPKSGKPKSGKPKSGKPKSVAIAESLPLVLIYLKPLSKEMTKANLSRC